MYTNAGKNGTLDYCQASLLLIIHWSILFTWLGEGWLYWRSCCGSSN